MQRDSYDLEFDTRMRRMLDATSMTNAADAYDYALMGLEHLVADDASKQQAILMLAPSLAAMMRLAEFCAEELGLDRQTVCRLVRDSLLHS
jgi:hypothetical protein